MTKVEFWDQIVIEQLRRGCQIELAIACANAAVQERDKVSTDKPVLTNARI